MKKISGILLCNIYIVLICVQSGLCVGMSSIGQFIETDKDIITHVRSNKFIKVQYQPKTFKTEHPNKETNKIEVTRVRFSPDGNKIAYIPEKNGFAHVFIYDVKRGTQTRLTKTGIRNYDVSWSPNGKKLVFSTTTSFDTGPGDSDIWVVNSDGSGLDRLSKKEASGDGAADWSPDNKKISFSGGDDEFSQICIMDPDGSGRRALTSGSKDCMPVWSPDGKKIAYYSFDGMSISVIGADGENNTEILTEIPGLQPSIKWLFYDQIIISVINKDTNGDGKIYYDDAPTLWMIDISNKKMKEIIFDNFVAGKFNDFDISNDGKQIVFSKADGIQIINISTPE